jgi:outer membrane usher protein
VRLIWLIGLLLLLARLAHSENGEVPFSVASADLLLEVEINGVRKRAPAIVRNSAVEGLLLRPADLAEWGIRFDHSLSANGRDDPFVSVALIPGLRARIDFTHQRLIVTAAPSLLPPSELRIEDMGASDPAPSVPGAFMGYDVLAGQRFGATAAAGQVQIGAFAGAWNASGTWQGAAASKVTGTRLDTTVSRDWPDRLLGMRLGDSITSAGYWGRSVRMGGIRWGTEFSVRPDLITFPLPAVRGEAVVPSTVDVYVNDTLRARREVPPGPFSISDLPVVSGSGQVRLVVRDSMGREQRVQQPYFASEDLLRPGLSMYSLEAGAVREDYGLENFAYGRTLLVGAFRRGITERFTAELRGEVLKGQQTAGAGVTAAVMPGVVVSAALAQSETLSAGTLAQLGLDFDRRALSAGVRLRTASAEFRQLGLTDRESPERRALDVQVGWLAGRAGSLGLVFADRTLRDRSDVRLLSMTYGISLGDIGYLGAFATHALTRAGDSQIALAWTRSIGDRTSTRVGADLDSSGLRTGLAVNRSLPAGNGAGFHVDAEEGDSARLRAGAAVQRDAGVLGIEAEHTDGYERYEAYARGGVVLMGRNIAAVRTVDPETSFAMVELPSLSGVPIYHDNHLVGVTDNHGVVVLAGLRPYEANRLRIDPRDLPIDAVIASPEYSVRPYRRGGVQVRFPVTGQGGAVVHLTWRPDGFVPAGATARVGAQQFTVAGEGAAYIAGHKGDVNIEVSWPGHLCRARIQIPADQVLPDLGAVACKETL